MLGLLLAHFSGYYIYFVVRMGQIRTEARKQLRHLPANQLTKFEFNEADFRSVRVDDQEIKVDGKMYDIAVIEKSGNLLTVYAKHDKAEDDLLAFFKEVFDQASNDTQTSPSSLTKFMSLSYLVEPDLVILTGEMPVIHFTAFINKEKSIFISLESPPPRA